MHDEEQNPFDYEARVTEAMKTAARWLDATRADGGAIKDLREAVALMHTELARLREKRVKAVDTGFFSGGASERKPALGKVMGLFHHLKTRFEERVEGARGGYVDGMIDATHLLEEFRPAFERVNRELIEAQTTELAPLVPSAGITYADPVGRFECNPAIPEWREFSREPEAYSVLELRVMAAHLSTSLDNVTQALRAKGAGV